jgi:hypothetical protein
MSTASEGITGWANINYGRLNFNKGRLDQALSRWLDTEGSLMHINLEWWIILENYTSRQLTYPTDIFPAIAGVARRISDRTGYTYKAGLWLETIHLDLLWYFLWTKRPEGQPLAPS